MKILKKNKRAGFTLVEILLVVGFIALAGIGIYTVYSKVQMSNAALTEGKNLDTIRAGVKNLYGGSQRYTGLTNTVLNDARVTPDSMRAVPYVAADAAITNSFGGIVTAIPFSFPAAVDNGFQVTYEKVPGAVCSKLVAGAGTGWDEIVVAAVPVKVFGTNAITVGTLASQCATDPGTGITIVFRSL